MKTINRIQKIHKLQLQQPEPRILLIHILYELEEDIEKSQKELKNLSKRRNYLSIYQT